MKIKINPDKCVVFFDFDNTITEKDSLDGLIERFSYGNEWIELEEKWKKKEIGSFECLSGQFRGLRVTKEKLDAYLSKVKIDPYFKILVEFLNSKNIKSFILSDNFDYILNRILSYHSISGLKIYANNLSFNENRLMPRFPFRDRSCLSCGHCKRKNLLENSAKDTIIVYIGDGQTDACPSEHADIVFAKEYLYRHFRKKNMPCFAYNDLKDVYDYLRGAVNE